ncbi:hypothetical protein GOODEAATRI_001089 [Goodea atripinnis]|uniref:Uncharacterized protein n=1 Tax=Goodea atripinnis TaxID=208336 RepID=A0ABV0PU97_9TELE
MHNGLRRRADKAKESKVLNMFFSYSCAQFIDILDNTHVSNTVWGSYATSMTRLQSMFHCFSLSVPGLSPCESLRNCCRDSLCICDYHLNGSFIINAMLAHSVNKTKKF